MSDRWLAVVVAAHGGEWDFVIKGLRDPSLSVRASAAALSARHLTHLDSALFVDLDDQTLETAANSPRSCTGSSAWTSQTIPVSNAALIPPISPQNTIHCLIFERVAIIKTFVFEFENSTIIVNQTWHKTTKNTVYRDITPSPRANSGP